MADTSIYGIARSVEALEEIASLARNDFGDIENIDPYRVDEAVELIRELQRERDEARAALAGKATP